MNQKQIQARQNTVAKRFYRLDSIDIINHNKERGKRIVALKRKLLKERAALQQRCKHPVLVAGKAPWPGTCPDCGYPELSLAY